MRTMVLMSSQHATVASVSAALQNNGRLQPDDICPNLAALVALLERTHPPAAVIDIDPEPLAQLAHLEPVIRRFADTRFVVVADEFSPDLLLEAMHAGARHFMPKRAIAADLHGVLKRLCPPDASAGHNGAVVAVLSAGGGAGSTTVAANIAAELAAASAQDVIAVDMDAAYGALPTFLGAAGQFGLLDLLHRGGAIDAELIHTTVAETSHGIHVLPVCATTGLPEEPLPAGPRLLNTLEACRSGYRHIVLDAPRLPAPVLHDLTRICRGFVIVLQLTLRDLRTAGQLMRQLADAGVPDAAILPVVNRYRRRTMQIELSDACKALRRPALTTLTNDFTAACAAINLGQPLAAAAPRSPLRRDIAALSAALTRLSAAPPRPSEPVLTHS